MNAVKSIVLGVLCLAAGMVQAAPLYQCPLTVSGYAEGKAALADFPVLVRISTAIDQFSYGDCAAGGADISFTSEDGETVYPHEVDTWNPDGESLVWVKLPSMEHGTKFLLRWADPNPPANDPTAVWSDYVGVWHFNENGGLSAADSSPNSFHGSVLASGANAADYAAVMVAGQTVGAGRQCTARSLSFTMPDYSALNVGGRFTASGIFKMAERTGYESFFSKKQEWNKGNGFQCNMQNSDETFFICGSGSDKTYSNQKLPNVKSNWTYLTLVYNGTAVKVYNKGGSVASFTINDTGDVERDMTVAGFKGIVDEVRIRKGTTSDDWVKAEYEVVMKADYLTVGTTESLSTTAIVVSSDSLRYGEVSPTYGQIAQPEAGLTYDFSCTVATQLLNEAETTRAVCTGWELRRLSDGGLIKTSSSEGESQFVCSHQYVQDEGVELKWRWQVQHKVTATAGTGGTVSPTEQWVDVGATCAPITAMANDGCGFYKWTGDVPAGGAGVNPLAFPVNAPCAVSASFGKCIYVALGGSDEAAGSAAAPYASIEKAITSAGAGDIVFVGEGTFALPTDLTFENTTGWKLRGAGIGKTILTGGSRHVRCFKLDHADAELSGFTLSGVTWNRDDSNLDRKYKGCAFYMTAGSVHDVRVTGATSAKTYWTYGTALYMTGGSAVDCIFDGCSGAQGECYGIVYQSGGLTERCTFYGNSCNIQGGALWLSGGTNSWSVFYNNVANSSNAQGGAVRMSGGTLMHATIYGNGAGTNSSANTGAQGGGLYHAGGVVTNCLVWGNSAPSQSAAGKPDWYTTKGEADQQKLIFNLCTTDAKGTNPIPYDPQLRDPANADFSLLASSPCILADGTTVGAIAYDRTKADAAMTVSPRTAFTTDAVTFAATTRNVASPVYSWVITDANGTEVKTSSDASFSSTFDAGIYDVSLVVTDGGTPVATDTRPAYFRIHPLTNVIAQASVATEATAELRDAIENAPDGQVIILDEGEWTLPSVTLLVDKNVKIFGQGVDKTFLHGGSRAAVCFTVSHKDAEMAGFTLDNLTWNSDNRLGSSACFNLSNGYLHDLVVKDINCDKTGQMIGLGTYMTGGHIADVVYDNCHGSRSDMVMNGSGVRQTAGLSERLVIRNCYGQTYGALYLSGGSNAYSKIYGNVARGSSAQGGGVTMTGGTLLHATIWGNGAGTNNDASTGAQGGGLYHSSGIVTNCIVWGNSAPSQTAAGKPDWYTSKGEADRPKFFFNVCSSVAIGTDPFEGDPLLTDPANGDFSPTASSKCIRPTYTIGAVEYDRTKPDAAMDVSPLAAFDTETICFTSTVMNVSNPVYAWTVTDAGGEVVKESSDAWFETTLARGVYDVKLVVKDDETPVKTDEHLAYLHIYSETNTIESGVVDALTAAVDDSIDGQVFLLQPGIHEVTKTVLVNNDLKLIGAGATNCVIRKTGGSNRAVYLNNEHALLTGVTVTGGRFNDDQRNSWGAGVLVGDNGGTVSYCVITNNGTASGHFMRGGGVGITGSKGLVTHCLIAHNTTKWKQSDFGGGAAISAGLLENCLIRDNEALMGGGVAVSGSGKVRNCTIVNNTAGSAGGGLCWWNASNGSAEVCNCVFSGNVADTDTSNVKPNVGYIDVGNNRQAYLSCSNSVFSCAYEGSAVLGEGSVVVKEPFEDAAGGNWHFKLGVAGVDAGTAYANGDAFAETDFDGCARIIGDAIDIGAFETDTGVFGASMNLDRTEALENDPFGVSATVTGSDDYDCSWTVYGPNGAVVANYTTVAWTNGFAAVGRYDIEMTVTDRDDPTKTVTDRRNGIFYVGPRAIDLVSGDDIIAAVEASLDGTKITLGPGEYVITNKFKIQKGIVIEGPGYKLCTVRPVDTIIGDRRVFHLNHADAVLRGITVTGGRLGTSSNGQGDTRGLTGGGVYIDTAGGLVENCRLTDNRAGTYNSHGGGVGVNSANGVVRNCLIDHNSVYWQGLNDETGGGVYLAAGVISNCVICANRATYGGGVYVASEATIASCTIASNTANTVGGIYFDSWGMSSRFRDSIVWGNVDRQGSPRDGTTYAPEYGVGATITTHDLINYCAFSEGTKLPTDDARHLMGVGNFTCDPGFKRFDRLDFRIKMFSPCDRVSSTGSWLGALEPYPAGLLLFVK